MGLEIEERQGRGCAEPHRPSRAMAVGLDGRAEAGKPGRCVTRRAVSKTPHQSAVWGTQAGGQSSQERTEVGLMVRSFSSPLTF